MKIHNIIIVIFILAFIFRPELQSQTLYNGVGHINSYYQQTWNVAGLLDDMSTTTPRAVFVVKGLTSDDDVCVLRHCIIRNAGYGAYCYKASSEIRYCTIRNNTIGVYAAYGTTQQV